MSPDHPDQSKKAETFRRLHRGARILILPNAWDVASARLFEDAGFPAVATSSAGLMVSLGYPDGEAIDREEFVAATRRIARALSVPLSADIVGGFGRSPKEVVSTVRSVIEAGAIGINIEDSVHETKELLPIPAQVERLNAVRKLPGALRPKCSNGEPMRPSSTERSVTTSSTASRLLGVDRNASTPSARRPGGPFRQAGDLSPFAVGSLERRDLELPHLEHLHHDVLRVPGLRIAEHISEGRGYDLPGET